MTENPNTFNFPRHSHTVHILAGFTATLNPFVVFCYYIQHGDYHVRYDAATENYVYVYPITVELTPQCSLHSVIRARAPVHFATVICYLASVLKTK